LQPRLFFERSDKIEPLRAMGSLADWLHSSQLSSREKEHTIPRESRAALRLMDAKVLHSSAC